MSNECVECSIAARKFPDYDGVCADINGIAKLHLMGVCRAERANYKRPGDIKEFTLQLISEDRRQSF